METKTHFRLLDPQINYLLYPQTRILFDDESLLDLYMSRTFGKLDVLKDQKHEWYDDGKFAYYSTDSDFCYAHLNAMIPIDLFEPGAILDRYYNHLIFSETSLRNAVKVKLSDSDYKKFRGAYTGCLFIPNWQWKDRNLWPGTGSKNPIADISDEGSLVIHFENAIDGYAFKDRLSAMARKKDGYYISVRDIVSTFKKLIDIKPSVYTVRTWRWMLEVKEVGKYSKLPFELVTSSECKNADLIFDSPDVTTDLISQTYWLDQNSSLLKIPFSNRSEAELGLAYMKHLVRKTKNGMKATDLIQKLVYIPLKEDGCREYEDPKVLSYLFISKTDLKLAKVDEGLCHFILSVPYRYGTQDDYAANPFIPLMDLAKEFCDGFREVFNLNEPYDDEDDIDDIDDIDDTNVVEPKHYTESGIETIDVIDAYTKGIPGPESFYVGNILKYVMRAPKKNGAEDYEKAFWYLTRLIGVERANQLMNDIYANRNEDDQKKGEN